ncbi:MAG: mannitol-1-phosphate 5-dehydrogenase, partial [Ligilactobacillus murinus]|nr:mannitol-1-phosphate 5-dehydrogenase [Ligilactobacillus murinus]
MMKALHFGAGNIGRGFIGEVLAKNGFEITFVDVNEKVITALNEKHEYLIQLAEPTKKQIKVTGVAGINNAKDPAKVAQAFAKADIVTTAIGPKILPLIAPLIAAGIKLRRKNDNYQKIDVIACENMIGGSQFLKTEVYKHLDAATKAFADEYIGFPNAAVDRIVPQQSHADPLFVVVEPFKEWVIDESQLRDPALKLKEVHYAKQLEPYIERKLFSVNTGHATVAYTGQVYGYDTIGEAIKDKRVLDQVKAVLAETRELLLAKWDFERAELEAYQQKIIERFENPELSDEITRVGRTPIRKLGYDERFIRPIREAKLHGLSYQALLMTPSRKSRDFSHGMDRP